MIQAIIFDLDGTLLDTLEDLKDSVNVALSDAGYPERSIDEVRQFVGNGIHKLIERAVPVGTGSSEIEKVFVKFRECYMVHCHDKTCAYKGIVELLEILETQGIKMAIVSNKADAAVKQLAKEYFPQISVAIGEREGIMRKPAPDSVLEAMKLLGVTKEQTIYVGDSEVDRQTAQNAGLACISVAWGFRPEEFLRSLHPEYLIHEPEEILNILHL